VVNQFYDQLNRVTEEARARADQFRRELPGRAARIADELTEQLPPELRAAGIHFAYDTTPED
jgi:hypothetical protein